MFLRMLETRDPGGHWFEAPDEPMSYQGLMIVLAKLTMSLTLSKTTNFRLFHAERVCIQQFLI